MVRISKLVLSLAFVIVRGRCERRDIWRENLNPTAVWLLSAAFDVRSMWIFACEVNAFALK